MLDGLLGMSQEQIAESFKATSIGILSLRTALIDKGICTVEELEAYDESATEAIELLIQQEQEKMKAEFKEKYGDKMYKVFVEDVDETPQENVNEEA